ncbi:MAG TPA: mercury(II) reductase, partial [Bacteroidetes bacterium]|nr:mercury(II) reductase [Bacteroidota bacterium]HEX04807.1 mercury(II) reductase [Bacteroidota bacterium]
MSVNDRFAVLDTPEVTHDTSKTSTMSDGQHFVILGGGSAAMSAAIKAGEMGAKVTIINGGLRFGGTCVNVGCVPSKALIRAAEANHRANHHPFSGISASSRISDFKALIQQKRDLVDHMQQTKYEDIFYSLPNTARIDGFGKIVGPGKIEVNGEIIEADNILIATGATQYVPDVSGLEDSGYLTNESAFELDELPESMIVLGGRYIALETAQMFSRLGSRVTLLQRSARILPNESADLTDELTSYLEIEGVQIITGVALQNVSREGDLAVVKAEVDGIARTFTASEILVATGRTPNTQNLGLDSVEIA